MSSKKTGDKVERVAKPIARVIDKLFKTDLEHCPECAEMREMLNDGKFLEALLKRIKK